jgi:uncharacterized protein (DUF2267 family)
MSATGLDVFDKTLQTTNTWLSELMRDEAIGPDRQVAWHVLGAVLHTVRDRVPPELAAHLGSQLPLLVRGLYYDGWRAPGHLDQADKTRSLEAFLEPVAERLRNTRPVNPCEAARAVFGVLSRHVNQGQIEKVRHALPAEVQAIWHDSPEAPDTRERAA